MHTHQKPRRLEALIEIFVFVALVMGVKVLVDPFLWKFAGPISLMTTIILLTIYMRVRGRAWAQTGLPPLIGPRAKLMLIPQMLLAMAGIAAAGLSIQYGATALGYDFMNTIPEGVEDRWGAIRGNLLVYLLWLGVIWTSAAFGEEMFFRGFLITQFQEVFRNISGASVLAVILPALLFGYLHYDNQGLRGALPAGAIGLAFGVLFLAFRKNLWPLIAVHGFVDTIGMTMLYLNMDV